MFAKKTEKATVAAKKPAAKKAEVKKQAEASVVKKVSVKKTAAPKNSLAVKKAMPSLGGLTRVIAKVNAGWGNSLYIRGNGAGLSWHKGVLMQCVDSDEWLWENKISKGSIEFKVLINDEIWALGDDVSVKAGETVTCHPTF